jgi:hypothetical protein
MRSSFWLGEKMIKNSMKKKTMNPVKNFVKFSKKKIKENYQE